MGVGAALVAFWMTLAAHGVLASPPDDLPSTPPPPPAPVPTLESGPSRRPGGSHLGWAVFIVEPPSATLSVVDLTPAVSKSPFHVTQAVPRTIAFDDGLVVVNGIAGDVVGYAMRGGKILIKGDVGYRVGIHMKAYKEKFPVLVIGGIAIALALLALLVVVHRQRQLQPSFFG